MLTTQRSQITAIPTEMAVLFSASSATWLKPKCLRYADLRYVHAAAEAGVIGPPDGTSRLGQAVFHHRRVRRDRSQPDVT